MKRVIAFITVLVFAICTCAVVSFSEGEYRYSLDATIKQIVQGETATLRLELVKDRSSFEYCGVNATIAVPFDISDVSYTVPGKTAVSVTPEKLDPEAETDSSNPYTFTIDYSPEFSVAEGASDTASGDIVISFKIGEEVKVRYYDVTVTSISVYVDRSEENGTSSEETPSENVSSETVSDENVSSEATSSEGVSSEDVSAETSQEATLEVYNAGHAKTDVDITPLSATDKNGSGSVLSIKVRDKNENNAQLSNVRVGINPEETEEGLVFENEFVLSPEFDSNKATYSVTVDYEATTVTIIPETFFSGADINYQVDTDNGASITSEGVVTLGSATTQRVTITVTSGQYKQKYYVNINRAENSNVSSETSSDETSSEAESIPGQVTSDSSSDATVSDPTVSDPSVSDTSSEHDPVVSNGKEGVSTTLLIIAIIIAFICGFVLCFILFVAGALPIGGPQKPKAEKEIKSDFAVISSPETVDSEYTATRVMPIPGGTGKKFEINIEYDESEKEMAENSQKESIKPEKEEKTKKQSFFFDDDEF